MENKRKSKKIRIASTNLMKPRKRRQHSRKTLSNCLINFAEARREIANALQYHHKRSISSPQNHFSYSLVKEKIGSFSTESPIVSGPVETQLQGVHGPLLTETEASVITGPTPIWEALKFDDDESSFAASYSWWVGFLESLDGKNNQESVKPVFNDEAGLLGQAHDWNDNTSESSSSSSSDEWLEILNYDDDHHDNMYACVG